MRVIFVRSKSFYGQAIRAFEGGEYNHCAYILEGTPDVIEADINHGVRRRRLDSLIRDSESFVILDLILPDEEAARFFALAQVGKKYDLLAILGFLLWRDMSKSNAWFCSGLLLHTAYAGGMVRASKRNRLGVRLAHEIFHAWQYAQAVTLSSRAPKWLSTSM